VPDKHPVFQGDFSMKTTMFHSLVHTLTLALW
jgi:hypothetical protein